jgi:hypothetical protein
MIEFISIRSPFLGCRKTLALGRTGLLFEAKILRDSPVKTAPIIDLYSHIRDVPGHMPPRWVAFLQLSVETLCVLIQMLEEVMNVNKLRIELRFLIRRQLGLETSFRDPEGLQVVPQSDDLPATSL